MKKSRVKRIVPGIYVVFWKSGGGSIAAIGVMNNGGRWIAPLNWAEPSCNQDIWEEVVALALLHPGK